MKNKIRIIYSKNSSEIFNRQAALGSYIYALGGLLHQHGYAVSINEHAYETIKQNTVGQNQSVVKTPFYKKIIPARIKQVAKDIFLFKRLEKMKKLLMNFQDDVILEFYSYGSDVGYALSSKKNIPLIVVYDAPVVDEYHFFNHTNPFFLKKINKRERDTLLKASATIVYSNAVKEHVWSKIEKQTRMSIHQNIDFTRFDFIDNKIFDQPINIGFIGSFLKWHRVDLLVAAFTRLKEEGLPVSLTLLGSGEEFNAIKKKCALNKFKTDIVLTGFVDGGELFRLKQQIHIGVMPGSNWYGAPNKIF
ncbi:MAG TPA: glycosyltransferase family 4 protein, partial [Bacteroidia bacterium]|nr:glycosyltransferase family 4 protein [Bacteroidia bacterium]